MKEIIMIKIQGCPYCAAAFEAVEELKKDAKFSSLILYVIDENEETEKAKPFAKDYYYVPTFFVDGKKMYEAHPGQDYDTIYRNVERVFEETVE